MTRADEAALTFRINMKTVRKVAGMRQQDVSDTAQKFISGPLSRATVSGIEAGRGGASIGQAKAIALALQVPLGTLIGESGVQNSPVGEVLASLYRTAESIKRLGRRLSEGDQSGFDLHDRQGSRLVEGSEALGERLHLVVDGLSAIEAELEHLELRLDRLVELLRDPECIHEDSLAGHGADPTAPMASGEGATSPDGDTVRDATDPGSPPLAGRAG